MRCLRLRGVSIEQGGMKRYPNLRGNVRGAGPVALCVLVSRPFRPAAAPRALLRAGARASCRTARPRKGGGSRKEVFQPHLPVRLPCYDLAPVTGFALGRASRRRTSGTPGSHGLTGGVYKARERIHRAVADARLLANPASWSRVADSNPN